jgi:ferredoxin
MKVRITTDCIACGVCVDNCPEVFEMGDDNLAHPKMETVPTELEEKVTEAAEACPVEAIVTE